MHLITSSMLALALALPATVSAGRFELAEKRLGGRSGSCCYVKTEGINGCTGSSECFVNNPSECKNMFGKRTALTCASASIEVDFDADPPHVSIANSAGQRADCALDGGESGASCTV